ncbi:MULTISPECIES: efflux RND transporter periplasmic adaptor subunit [Agrobacterium tumefaciens complex]|uniref:efflux RND transporter periplasmic adaptor subunit n=1 Tax=Agrobacterium tumefaciens complex TaxID=1183400 RepID=UPI000DD01D78|nr:efflux RND transporter periplasmic adaptor subunit [Agrobacterium tumefaciens]MDP9788480.1 RND family efflux transporter MFP subunit [Agrobacterium tumefaciens]MDP9856168.1 RND family efflux transporter MFP subunit [Agrobacterium tumefaciens]
MKTILIAAALGGIFALSSCSNEEPPAEKPLRTVGVVAAEKKPVDRGSVITGEVRARVQTDLSFRVSGKITERLVDVGTRVKTGQLLARMDPEEQKADLDVALANLQSAEAQQTQAQLTFDRQQSLFRTQVTSRSAVDKAQETLLTTQGAVRSAQAQLDTARDALSYTELRADADGVITARNVEVGQVAQAAQLVFTLAHDGPRDAVFDVYESLFLERDIDNLVNVSLLSDPTRSVAAPVREISPTIDPDNGTIRVKVGLNGDLTMPLGAPVSGHFRFKQVDAIELPWSAMTSQDGFPAVWVVDPQSSEIAMRRVEVADYETGQFAIAQGLNPGDLVVTVGTKFLRTGEKVAYEKGQAQ